MTLTPTELAALRDEYEQSFDRFSRFAVELARYCDGMLRQSDAQLVMPVHGRVKTWASVEEKIARKKLACRRLTDLSDLVGLRVVVRFQDEIPAVIQALPRIVFVLEEEDTSERLQSPEFGYKSVHFVCTIPRSPALRLSWDEFRDLRAEIQVRTLCQHAWAELAHSVSYKPGAAHVPQGLLRDVHSAAALLEVADQKIVQVREGLEQAEEQRHRFGSQEIDGHTLKEILAHAVPHKYRQSDKGLHAYDRLAAELRDAGIGTVALVESFLIEWLPKAREHEAAALQQRNTEVGDPSEFRWVARADVLWSELGLVGMALRLRSMAVNGDPPSLG